MLISLKPASWLSVLTTPKSGPPPPLSSTRFKLTADDDDVDDDDDDEGHELLSNGDASGSVSGGRGRGRPRRRHHVPATAYTNNTSRYIGTVRVRTWYMCAVLLILFVVVGGSGVWLRRDGSVSDVKGTLGLGQDGNHPADSDEAAVGDTGLRTRPWKKFPRLEGYYHGIGSLVRSDQWQAENPYDGSHHSSTNNTQNDQQEDQQKRTAAAAANDDFQLTPYSPPLHLPPSIDETTLPPRQKCFLNENTETPYPPIYAFQTALPNHSPNPLYGSYAALDLRPDVCFERYGRYGPYGLGYEVAQGGTGLGMHGDRSRTGVVWAKTGFVDWREVDLGMAQRRCFERNRGRYHPAAATSSRGRVKGAGPPADFLGSSEHSQPTTSPPPRNKPTTLPRTAILLRAWEGLDYTPALRLYIRSLVSELSLYTSGEYDVHLLIELKSPLAKYPIYASAEAHDAALQDINVPREFRSMATLWSQEMVRVVYPGPFEPHFAEHGDMYPAMRSMHFALQWWTIAGPWAKKGKGYDFVWNWEVDVRYVGHWYELLSSVGGFARRQKRSKGLLWEQAARFYVPGVFGDDFGGFVKDTVERSPSKEGVAADDDDDEVEEEADYISLNPIFDPANTLWNRRNDVSGWPTDKPIPNRRSSIIVASRFSRRLLEVMHNETYLNRHSMGSEMFPPSVALHHGLKAVYAPHPVYTERDWSVEFAEQTLNGGGPGMWAGGFEDSVFGEGPRGMEDGLKEASWYYDSFWAGLLWRRWLGYKEKVMESWVGEKGVGVGGEEVEMRSEVEAGWGGRMCLRSMLLHPVKHDVGIVD